MTQAGSATEFLGLFEPLQHELFNYARNALSRSDLAADVVQEVALTAWREFSRYEPGTNFRAWLYRIVVNTVFTWNRRGGRERLLQSRSMTPERIENAEGDWSELLRDPALLREALDSRLALALDALRDDERHCILLRLVGNFSYREIGELLEMPMGTAMSHVHRARSKLRERLGSLARESGVTREGRP